MSSPVCAAPRSTDGESAVVCREDAESLENLYLREHECWQQSFRYDAHRIIPNHKPLITPQLVRSASTAGGSKHLEPHQANELSACFMSLLILWAGAAGILLPFSMQSAPTVSLTPPRHPATWSNSTPIGRRLSAPLAIPLHSPSNRNLHDCLLPHIRVRPEDLGSKAALLRKCLHHRRHTGVHCSRSVGVNSYYACADLETTISDIWSLGNAESAVACQPNEKAQVASESSAI